MNQGIILVTLILQMNVRSNLCTLQLGFSIYNKQRQIEYQKLKLFGLVAKL